MRNNQRTAFAKWMGAILDALRALGDSGKPKEVIEWIIQNYEVSDDRLNERLNSGGLRFRNQVYWARQYLVWDGLLDSTTKGVWKLSEKGETVTLTEDEAHTIFLKWVAIHSERRKSKEGASGQNPVAIDEIELEENTSIKADYKQELIRLLRRMTPLNFEKFSLLLLRLNNFEDLRLTGGSKDEGIDGFAILRINPFVSFRVLFQCKRYGEDNKIRRTQIADFRNSMLGRADKGIFIATTYFTRDAETEANRDGAPPIELLMQTS